MPMIQIDDPEKHRRVCTAAKKSRMVGGFLPQAEEYKHPALVHYYETEDMGDSAWEALKAEANWVAWINADAYVNLDHPDVKAVL